MRQLCDFVSCMFVSGRSIPANRGEEESAPLHCSCAQEMRTGEEEICLFFFFNVELKQVIIPGRPAHLPRSWLSIH